MKNKILNKIKQNKKEIIKVGIIVIFIIFLYSVECVYAAPATPTLVTKLTSAFKKIKEYLIKIAGPIAAVAIVSGIIIRKLSFGDEEKMVVGKRVIVNAIGGYFVILLVDLIIKFIEAIV